MNKLFVFAILLITLLTFSKGAIRDSSLTPILKITKECIECLKKQNILSNSSVNTLKPGMMINEDTLIELIENDNRSLLRNLAFMNSYHICFPQLFQMEEVIEIEDSTTLEDELFKAIFEMETLCGDKIKEQFNKSRQEGIDCICDKKESNENDCFPSDIRSQVKNHFNDKCRIRMGKNVFEAE